MHFTSTTVIPDPREAALTRARQLYPAMSVAEQIAVAEFLLRREVVATPMYPRPVYPAAPWTVTCGGGGNTVLEMNGHLIARALGGRGGRPDDDGTAGVLARLA